MVAIQKGGKRRSTNTATSSGCRVVIFLVAIFFAAAALFSPSEAVRMYQGFRQTLLSWLLPVHCWERFISGG